MKVHEPMDLLPIRQIVAASAGAWVVFAQGGLLERLSRPGRYQFLGLGQGGEIRAVNEHALADARRVLRQAYGTSIVFGEPMVHTFRDAGSGRVMVPVMFMRVDVARASERSVLELLAARGAEMKDMCRQRNRLVIRLEIELRQYLGLEALIAEATDGRAHILSWLLGYRPPPQPSQAATDCDRAERSGAERRAAGRTRPACTGAVPYTPQAALNAAELA